MVVFGQLVVGPPGSGKSTYCNGLHQFLNGIERKTIIVNLDPANDMLTYECAIDVRDLVDLESVMTEKKLGPNGAMIFCMEYLTNNVEWLQSQLLSYKEEGYYVLFDCPGQVELYTHDGAVPKLLSCLLGSEFRLCVVNLMDSFHCSDASKFISLLLVTLRTMLHLELPQVNVLSKIDILESQGKCDFNLEFYTQVMDLRYLEGCLNESVHPKFRKMNKVLCELIDDFSLISFQPLAIEEKESVINLVKLIDKANGYAFGA